MGPTVAHKPGHDSAKAAGLPFSLSPCLPALLISFSPVLPGSCRRLGRRKPAAHGQAKRGATITDYTHTPRPRGDIRAVGFAIPRGWPCTSKEGWPFTRQREREGVGVGTNLDPHLRELGCVSSRLHLGKLQSWPTLAETRPRESQATSSSCSCRCAPSSRVSALLVPTGSRLFVAVVAPAVRCQATQPPSVLLDFRRQIPAAQMLATGA